MKIPVYQGHSMQSYYVKVNYFQIFQKLMVGI